MSYSKKMSEQFDKDFEVTYEDDDSITYKYDDYEDDDYDAYYDADRDPGAGAPLAEPIQKGGRAVQSLSYALCRNLSLILILAIIGTMIYDFLRGSAPYGDYMEAFSTQTFTPKLAAYFVVAAFFVLYELLAACWAMTKQRVYYMDGVVKEDVGRGKFSFMFIYICSYAAFLTSKYIPDTPEILTGIKGALDVFGAMHNLLFWLCLIGVISCIIRKRFLD